MKWIRKSTTAQGRILFLACSTLSFEVYGNEHEMQTITEKTQIMKDERPALEAKTNVVVKATMPSTAEEVATNRLETVFRKYAAGEDTVDYHGKVEFHELLSVASNAWPCLKKEWLRLVALPPGQERDRRLRIIKDCWTVTKERRALGLLVQCELEEPWNIGVIFSVESIADVGFGIVAEMTPEQKRICIGRMADWWKAYRPQWEREMTAKDAMRTQNRQNK